MPIETAADRAVFTSPNDFGDVGQYTRAGGGSIDINGLFDDPTLNVGMNDAVSIDAQPTFFCSEADLPAGAEGDEVDRLTVNSRLFAVVSVEPDGKGMALLRLGAPS